jgi:hypothetical protein
LVGESSFEQKHRERERTVGSHLLISFVNLKFKFEGWDILVGILVTVEGRRASLLLWSKVNAQLPFCRTRARLLKLPIRVMHQAGFGLSALDGLL